MATAETSKPATKATVIRISPMAHFASGFLALSILVFIPLLGPAAWALLIIPVLASVAIERLRTVADHDAVTARGLLNSRTVPWPQIEGLKFTRGGWARACRVSGDAVALPAVTFATLPRLAEASGGRVPNPYRR
ncbi:MAG: PH domain-containing protein [Mycobacterium sp.]